MVVGGETADQFTKQNERVAALQSLYGNSRASAGSLLCDRHNPEAVAFTIVGADLSSVDLTYRELREESEPFASALAALGVGAGDRVATLMGKSSAYVCTVMGIWRLGAVHVPLFTAFAPPAIALRLVASSSKVLICDAGQRSKLFPSESMPQNPPWKIITMGPPDANALSYHDLLASHRAAHQTFSGAAALGGDAPIVQIYTSGTTGAPKGVVVPLRAVASFQLYMEYGLDLREDDVFWNAADPGWAYGLYFAIIGPLATGERSILLEAGFSADLTFGVLSRYGVTNFAAAPTVFRALRASGREFPGTSKLRCASSAGEPLTLEVNEWARRVLGVTVHDHYGQTEAGMVINNHHHRALKRPLKEGSMGHAMPGWKAAIVKLDRDEQAPVGELGRLAIDLPASPLAWFEGYSGDTSRSIEKFSFDRRWYVTGDAGSMDSEGYVYFSARDDDVIIMSGYRIGPVEIESILLIHEAVSECAVVAGPDELRGESLEAFVVLCKDRVPSDALTSELQESVKQRYAAHAYPRRVHYVDSLPRTPSGKVQRFLLRRQLHENHASRIDAAI